MPRDYPVGTLADTNRNVQTRGASGPSLHLLQREIEDLRRKNARPEGSIARERSLQKNRDGALGGDAGGNEALHWIEVFDEIISGKAKICHACRCGFKMTTDACVQPLWKNKIISLSFTMRKTVSSVLGDRK